MFAYLHHLYMDFAQPQWLQVAGQLSSYLISVPAAVVTIFSTLALVDGSNTRWKLPSMLLYLGVMGWAIGGVAAVIDSTVMVNTRFHNTLWVPAHFHTYYVMGVVLMILGTVFHLAADLSKLPESRALTRAIVATVGVGGYGFLLMFYLAGVAGVPRRYAVYPEEVARGILYAKVSLLFITVLLLGALLYMWEAGRRCVRAFRRNRRPSTFSSSSLTLGATAAAQPDPRSHTAGRNAAAQQPAPRHHADDCDRRTDLAVVVEPRQTAGARIRLHALRRRVLAVPAILAGSGPVASRDRPAIPSPRDQLRSAGFSRRHEDARGAPGASDDPDWTFAVAAPEDVRRLARRPASGTTGTRRGSSSITQPCWPAFATAGWYGFSSADRSARHGSSELVREVSGEFVASYPLPGRVRFRCVQFDAATGRVTLDWGFALLLVPMAVTAATTLLMFWRQEVRRVKSEV